MPMIQSGNSFIMSSVDLMDLAAVWTVAGLAFVAVVETGAGHGVFVPGHMTVMALFIFMTASFLLEGRPRMAGPGVSATYQYEFTQLGQAPGWPDCQVMGPQSAPYGSIWDPLLGSESGADMIQASGKASWADLLWIKASKYM